MREIEQSPNMVAKASKLTMGNENAHVIFDECSVCGWLAWSGTLKQPSGGIKLFAQPVNPGSCHRCQEVNRRYPEVWDWANAMVTVALRDYEAARQQIETKKIEAAKEVTDGTGIAPAGDAVE